MTLRINTNMMAIQASNLLNSINGQMSKNQERLTTGNRINRAADDPAGLIIANKFASQISGLEAAIKNVDRGIDLIETADSSLEIVEELLGRAKKLSLSSMDGTLSDAERTANNEELTEIKDSIDRIVDGTKFGDNKILDGSTGTLTFQIGAIVGDTYDLTINDMNTDQLGDGTNTFDGSDVSTAADAATALATIEGAIDQVSAERGKLGATQANTFEMTRRGLEVQRDSLKSAKATVMETDMAAEMADFNRNQVRLQVANLMLSAANQQSGLVLNLFG